MFIAIEGCDAAGKATQTRMLVEWLKANYAGVPVRAFSFPAYDTPAGRLVKDHLHGGWRALPQLMSQRMGSLDQGRSIDALVFQCIQTVNRLELAAELKLAADVGFAVSDRYIASGLVYGHADGVDAKWLEKTQAYLPQPDFQVLLDIDPVESERRQVSRGRTRDRYETEEGLMARVIDGYRNLWLEKMRAQRSTGTQWVVVDGASAAEKVQARIIEATGLQPEAPF